MFSNKQLFEGWLSKQVRRCGLETPVLLGLEVARPFSFFLQQGLILLAPLAGGVKDNALMHLAQALDEPERWDEWRRLLTQAKER